jgi:N-terminal region of Chorein or VPS13
LNTKILDTFTHLGIYCLSRYNTSQKWPVFNKKFNFFVLTRLQAINSIFEAQGWDFEVTSGKIESVTVNVPWNRLMSEDSFVEVNGLCLHLRPHARAKEDGE